VNVEALPHWGLLRQKQTELRLVEIWTGAAQLDYSERYLLYWRFYIVHWSSPVTANTEE